MEGIEKNLLFILRNFRNENPVVTGIVLSTMDGLPIASDPKDCAELLCATAAAVYAAGRGMGVILGMDDLRCAIVEAERGVYLISGSESTALLLSFLSREEADAVSRKLPELWTEIETFLGAI